MPRPRAQSLGTSQSLGASRRLLQMRMVLGRERKQSSDFGNWRLHENFRKEARSREAEC